MPEVSEMLAGPRWMQPEDPVKWLAKGYEMGEERRQFDIYQQRLKEIDALTKRAKDQEYELNSINLKNKILDREQMIASDGAYSKIAKIFSDHKIAGIAGTDSSEGRIHSAIANDPSFYRHPGAKNLLDEMELSRSAREKASQREADALYRDSIVAMQQEGLTARKQMDVESRKDIAETRSQADIEKAQIAAKAKVDVATIAASKWKDHSRFAAFKDASKSIALSIDPAKEPEKWADAIGKAYNEILPSGEPNAWDSTPATGTLAPIEPMPKSRAEFDAIPSGAWYINPADGKRYRKK